jgi:hypothetical protein
MNQKHNTRLPIINGLRCARWRGLRFTRCYSHRPLRGLPSGPDGAGGCSYGWSGAEPVV